MSESSEPTGLAAHGIRPKTILREPTTNGEEKQICPEDGRPIGGTLGTQTIAHPEIAGDGEADELLTHGWLCVAHPTPIVMPRHPSEMPDGWESVELVIADQRTREVPVPVEEVPDVE
ncbi:hypothetical protein [Salinarchaeum laminariae]|uniref:hypothetical protein n=1 Tax=Salinarchaeum laminariae TaxID=869888 RepID=UPI0020BDEEC1|nr:hypothetical protein [Salinarchaeum laminariae]